MDRIYNTAIDLSQPEIDIYQNIKGVVREILCENSEWVNLEDNFFDISVLTGGITNTLFLVENKISSSKIIVRVFGKNTALFIDRNMENLVFSKLSTTGNAPLFYGLFLNGRIEGYLPARALISDEMSDAGIYPLIAATMAKFHVARIIEIEGNGSLWSKLNTFFSIIEDKNKILSTSKMSAIKAEIQWLKSLIYSKECNTLSVQDCGTRFAYQKVLCHNDLLSGNILLHDTSATANEDNTPIISEDITSSTPSTNQRSCSLIDFEYSFYNYRAYDLANHFCEHSGFNYDVIKKFPSKEFMHDFILEYLKQHKSYCVNKSVNINISDNCCCASLAATSSSREETVDSSTTTTTTIEPEHVVSADQWCYCCNCHTLNSNEYESFVLSFQEAINYFILLSHLFWATWSAVQAATTIDNDSSNDFDYAHYSALRYEAYYYHKQIFLPSA